MLRLILLGSLIGLGLAWRYLPWWALLLGLLVIIVAFKLFGRFLLLIPFRMKGKVLRDATATIDGLQPCERPKEVTAADDITRWWQLEVTIAPNGVAEGPFTMWQPGELVLTVRNKVDLNDAADDHFPIADLEIYIEASECAEFEGENVREGWNADQGWKLPGKRRLRFKFGTPDSVQKLRFQYYLELFGSLELPKIGSADRAQSS